MSNNCSCGCNCKDKKNKDNFTSSVEEGCNRNSVKNPKTATNNQW